MLQITVAVYSETGNTQQVAGAIARAAEAEGHAVRLIDVSRLPQEGLGGGDLLFLGSTCHSADLAAPVREALEALPDDASLCVAGFVTHSTWTPSDDPAKQALYEQWAGKCQQTFERICREEGLRFVGFFSCMGKPNPGIEQFIKNTIITGESEWAEYISEAGEHPNQEDLQNARAFVRRMIDLLR